MAGPLRYIENTADVIVSHTYRATKASSRGMPYLQTLLKLLLLLVYYTKSEVDLIGLFEAWFHTHDLREGLLRMLERSVSVVQNANAIP